MRLADRTLAADRPKPRTACQRCASVTSEGKPFCLACLPLLPAARLVLDELSRREAGDVCASVKDDVLVALATTPLTLPRLARATGLEVGTVRSAVAALRRERRVKTLVRKSGHGPRRLIALVVEGS